MTEFLGLLHERTSRPVTFLSNCPMIGMSTSIPQPIKGILWELSKTHDANVRELTAGMERVFYYPQPRSLGSRASLPMAFTPRKKATPTGRKR